MFKVDIKPISVNVCWQGRRFKTPKYKGYIEELTLKLPKLTVPNGKLSIKIIFGFSNSSSDIDNPLKPFLDILQKKYKFNDSSIYALDVRKDKVKKGEDYIEFIIEPFEKDF